MEYWFSTLATLLLSGDKGFSHGDRLHLSIILLALLRCELSHDVGKANHATIAWLRARKLHLGTDEARKHTALMYTDDVVLAAVGTDRVVALLRAWHKVTSSVRRSHHGHPREAPR
eukprot:3745989-Pleurochrysis_carterae.AAC.1